MVYVMDCMCILGKKNISLNRYLPCIYCNVNMLMVVNWQGAGSLLRGWGHTNYIALLLVLELNNKLGLK